MGITALIVGGLGAAGAIGSSMIQSNASQNASNAQVGMQQQALAQQQSMFGQGLSQQLSLLNQGQGLQSGYFDKAQTAFDTARNALSPYATAGQNALPTLQGLLTPGPNQNVLLSQTPGFQFANQYGNMAATNALASRGLGASAGPVATAAAQYSSGLASNTWQSVVNALQGYAGLGGNAAAGIANSANNFAGIAGNAGNTALGAFGGAGSNILSSATGAGNAQANTLTGIGNAKASGILGSANAVSGGVSGVTNSLSTAALLSGLQGGGGGLYSPNALTNGPSNSVISNATDAQAAQYESMFGAKGGHTSGKSGGPFIVGENGPELFIPDGAGTVVPYKRLKKAMDGKNCLTTRGLTRKLGAAA